MRYDQICNTHNVYPSSCPLVQTIPATVRLHLNSFTHSINNCVSHMKHVTLWLIPIPNVRPQNPSTMIASQLIVTTRINWIINGLFVLSLSPLYLPVLSLHEPGIILSCVGPQCVRAQMDSRLAPGPPLSWIICRFCDDVSHGKCKLRMAHGLRTIRKRDCQTITADRLIVGAQ